ncbi:MAG: CoF synthetase [Proteobacteria bacterium]|nr:CoF synthetase [Pseudomonadota bacterium]
MTQLLDVARGAYAKLPYATRSRIGTVLRLLPARYRYGSTYSSWRATLKRTRGNAEAIRTMQDQARVAMVREAFAKSPFYRTSLSKIFGAGFDPASVLDPEVWSQIPLLSPESVSDIRDALCTRPSSELDSGSTGGTSGKPVRFFLDRGRSPIEYAFVFDAWSRVGYREGDWRAVFRGVEVLESAVEKDAALAELRFSIFNLTDDLMARFRREIEENRIVYLHGYPSAIGMFASWLLRSGHGPMPKIRAVMLMGERLYPNYRESIEKAFPNAELVPFFGLSEKCAFAVEVAGKPDTYDFEPLYGFTELLDQNDRPVTVPGQRGRLVSTGLLFKGMPFIRYDTRDEATLVEAPSAENGWRLRVERIVPRRGHEFLVSRDGKLIPILALLVFGKEMDDIREFQFVQERPGEALIRVVRPKDGPEPDVQPFIDLVSRKSNGLVTITCEFVDALPTSPRAKRRFIDQRLDVSAIENAMNLQPDAVARDGVE